LKSFPPYFFSNTIHQLPPYLKSHEICARNIFVPDMMIELKVTKWGHTFEASMSSIVDGL